MWNSFFKHIDINPKNAYILDGNASDLEKECEAFEKTIAEAGGVQLFVGGKVCMELVCQLCSIVCAVALVVKSKHYNLSFCASSIFYSPALNWPIAVPSSIRNSRTSSSQWLLIVHS
jgi:hypothetical protein